MSAATSTHPNIAIIGGGLGGLVVLLTLARRGIPTTLYERDADLSERAHLGSMLDLGYESGQRALRENGLEEAFQANSRIEGQEMRIGGKDGVPLLHFTEKDPLNEQEARPEIDRNVLRKMLADTVPADAMMWGHQLASIRSLENGKHELTFSNGLVTVADVVVGADGANSHLRPLVSSAAPIYHEVTGAEISLAPEIAASPGMADVREAVGLGSCFLAEDNRVLAFQRNGDGRIRAFAWIHSADPYFPGEAKEGRKALLELFSGWAPWMRKFIEHCDDTAVYPRPIYRLPVGHRWEHKTGITLIGDAAHLMSPAAGAGANLAMLDGLELGLALADSVSKGASVEGREAALAAVEEKMFVRAEKSAAFSYNNMSAFVNPDAPQSIVAAWKAFIGAGSRREA